MVWREGVDGHEIDDSTDDEQGAPDADKRRRKSQKEVRLQRQGNDTRADAAARVRVGGFRRELKTFCFNVASGAQ